MYIHNHLKLGGTFFFQNMDEGWSCSRGKFSDFGLRFG